MDVGYNTLHDSGQLTGDILGPLNSTAGCETKTVSTSDATIGFWAIFLIWRTISSGWSMLMVPPDNSALMLTFAIPKSSPSVPKMEMETP